MTLAANNLAFVRHLNPLFKHIHFSLQAGETLQVLGRNGCGKTTLLRILAGLIEPDMGNITWLGNTISQQRDHYQQQLQYLGHHNGMKPQLTVAENLQLSAALHQRKLKTTSLHTIAEKMGLQSHLTTQTQLLSAGQCRRLALARIILRPASLWILDEPTTALDAEGHALFATLLNQHLTAGGIAVIATHQKLPLTNTTKILHLGEEHA